jgi:hypothetical protein
MLSIVLVLLAASARAQSGSANVEFCNFGIDPAVVRGNATFSVIYTFHVGPGGAPELIRAVEDRYVGEAAVRRCLSSWKLPATKEPIVAVFTWEHSVGWITLSISGADFKYVVRVSGNRCQYLGRQGHPRGDPAH